TLESPAGTVIAKWVYDRGTTTTFTNPPTVVVTDPMNNDTVYHYHVSRAYGNGIGLDPDDGVAPEWRDGLNYQIDYFEGRVSGGRLLRSELQEHDSDPYNYDPFGRSKLNIRVKNSRQQEMQGDFQESAVSRSDWDQDAGKYRTESRSGTDISGTKMS